MRISTHFLKKELRYTGEQLRPHFLLTEMGLKGSAIGAFIGPCHVETGELVDWEDRLAQDRIEAKWMVHFIGEFFGLPLREGVLTQRLIMAILGESIGQGVRRDGDDLFIGERKLSVSIATATPVSALLHIGINIDPEGAPVPAIGLQELGITPETWVPQVLEHILSELSSIEWACAKVRPVI